MLLLTAMLCCIYSNKGPSHMGFDVRKLDFVAYDFIACE